MSEYEDVILAIDEGTSGTRAAVVAQNSQVRSLLIKVVRAWLFYNITPSLYCIN